MRINYIKERFPFSLVFHQKGPYLYVLPHWPSEFCGNFNIFLSFFRYFLASIVESRTFALAIGTQATLALTDTPQSLGGGIR